MAAIPIADVATNLADNRKSGILTLHLGDEVRRIVFREGKIVSYGDSRGFSIPLWFEQKGMIDPAIFQKAMRRYKKAKRKTFGEIVAKLGGMEHEVYISHVQSIAAEMLQETLTFREGTFEFDEREPTLEDGDREMLGCGVQLAMASLLMEAARQMDDWEAIRRSLPSDSDIYRITPSEKAALEREMEGDPAALAVIDLLDGTRSVRSVLNGSPTSRFDASRVLATLVSQQRARPVGGDELVEQVANGESEENSQALAQLRSALKREPGNRMLLQKLAELSVAEGLEKEGAVYHKMLANSFLDEGNLDGAIRELKRSLELKSNDIATWQKLYEFTDQKGDTEALLQLGNEIVQRLRDMDLNELARDHLLIMQEKFPKNMSLRFEHADTLFALGERQEAIKKLLDLTRDCLQRGRHDDAEKALAKIIEYDPKHKRAREIYEKIRTGKIKKQRERRRTLIRATIAAVLFALVGGFLGYDYHVRQEFAITTREVLAEGLIEKGEYDRALRRLRTVLERHPLSTLRFFEDREILRVLEDKARMDGD